MYFCVEGKVQYQSPPALQYDVLEMWANKGAPQQWKKRVLYKIDDDKFVQVYINAYCFLDKGHPRGGFGIFWGDRHFDNTSLPLSGNLTHHGPWIQAAARAIYMAIHRGFTKLTINTVYQSIIDIAALIPEWKRNGWNWPNGTPMANKIYLEELDAVMYRIDVKWAFVPYEHYNLGVLMTRNLASDGADLYTPPDEDADYSLDGALSLKTEFATKPVFEYD